MEEFHNKFERRNFTLLGFVVVGQEVLHYLNVFEMLVEVGNSLEGLIHGIDETRVDEIPMRLQRHIIGVLSCIGWLLCNMTHVVVCYHEHHDYSTRRLIAQF